MVGVYRTGTGNSDFNEIQFGWQNVVQSRCNLTQLTATSDLNIYECDAVAQVQNEYYITVFVKDTSTKVCFMNTGITDTALISMDLGEPYTTLLDI